MKKWFIIGGLMLSNIVFLLLYVGSLSTIQSQESIIEKEKTASMGTERVHKNQKKEQDAEASVQQNKIAFIKQTFTTLFDYGNDDYLTRFDVVKGEISKTIIKRLSGMAGGTIPKTTFQNKVQDIRVYIRGSHPNETNITDVLVYMTSSYEIEGSDPSQRHQLFRADIKTNKDSYTITALESYGYIKPLSQS